MPRSGGRPAQLYLDIRDYEFDAQERVFFDAHFEADMDTAFIPLDDLLPLQKWVARRPPRRVRPRANLLRAGRKGASCKGGRTCARRGRRRCWSCSTGRLGVFRPSRAPQM